jgi:two-component sensor histidine kinase
VPLTTAPQTVTLELQPVPEAAGRARRALVRAGLDADLEHTVSLLATELVSNAIRHSGADLRVDAVLLPDFARVEVTDDGDGFDPDIRHEVSGFGLRLVEKLASHWGVECGDRTRVWFEVDRRRRRFDRPPPD